MSSKAKISKKNALDNAKLQLNEYQKKLNKNLEVIKKEKVGKEVTDERKTLLDKLKDLEDEKLKLDNELKKYKESNPEEYERMKKNIVVCKAQPELYFYTEFIIKHVVYVHQFLHYTGS